MVWRPAYHTLVARNVGIPTLERRTDVLVGGFDFEALRDMSIWRRLAVADASQHRYLEAIFLPNPQPADRTMLETIVPPSLLATTLLMEDENGVWQNLIQAGKGQCFAAAIKGNQAPIIMKGIPTEEAWDAFLEALGT